MAKKKVAKKAPAKKAPAKKGKRVIDPGIQPGEYNVSSDTSITLDSEPHISLAFGGPVTLTVFKTEDGKTMLTFKKA